MSILIKNMKMPESCRVCRFACEHFLSLDGLLEKFSMLDSVRSDCPLVEVPPHGRLIDADALKSDCEFVHSMMVFGGQKVYTQSAIDDAPTIIEEEGFEDE